jgi:membrane protease YdiL (CAAX protease family)
MSGKAKNCFAGLGDPAPPAVASFRHTVLFLCLFAGRALADFFLTHWSLQSYTASRLVLYVAIVANQIFFVWVIVIGIHARGGTAINLVGKVWHSPWDGVRDLFLGVAVLVIASGLSAVVMHLTGEEARETSALTSLLPKSPLELTMWVLTATTAGTCEEIIFRGYLQRQFWSMTGRLSAAIVLQGAIFGAFHLYQGWKAVIGIAFYGCAGGLLAAWRKSLLPGIVAHSLADIIGGIVGAH